MKISTLVEYLTTWSGYSEYAKRNPDSKLLKEVEKTFIDAIPNGSQDSTIDAVFPWFILMCRKPQ